MTEPIQGSYDALRFSCDRNRLGIRRMAALGLGAVDQSGAAGVAARHACRQFDRRLSDRPRGGFFYALSGSFAGMAAAHHHRLSRRTDHFFHLFGRDCHVAVARTVCVGIGDHRHASRRFAADDGAGYPDFQMAAQLTRASRSDTASLSPSGGEPATWLPSFGNLVEWLVVSPVDWLVVSSEVGERERTRRQRRSSSIALLPTCPLGTRS